MNNSKQSHAAKQHPSEVSSHNLEWLILKRETAKQKVEQAQSEFNEINSSILAITGSKDEGSATIHTDQHKITVTQPIYRKISDPVGLQSALPDEAFRLLTRVKHELNVSAFKKLEKEIALKVSRYIETKPGKVQLKIERI